MTTEKKRGDSTLKFASYCRYRGTDLTEGGAVVLVLIAGRPRISLQK
jgi:hypothetical protein